jgi:hypothetical protein
MFQVSRVRFDARIKCPGTNLKLETRDVKPTIRNSK